jgi:hypothetical protein
MDRVLGLQMLAPTPLEGFFDSGQSNGCSSASSGDQCSSQSIQCGGPATQFGNW